MHIFVLLIKWLIFNKLRNRLSLHSAEKLVLDFKILYPNSVSYLSSIPSCGLSFLRQTTIFLSSVVSHHWVPRSPAHPGSNIAVVPCPSVPDCFSCFGLPTCSSPIPGRLLFKAPVEIIVPVAVDWRLSNYFSLRLQQK